MNRAQFDEVLEACREDVPEILDELYPSLERAAIEAMSEDGTGKVSISLSLKIDYSKSPPSFAFDGAVAMKTKITGPTRTADDTPPLPGLEKAKALKK